jgi:hypothetical protein
LDFGGGDVDDLQSGNFNFNEVTSNPGNSSGQNSNRRQNLNDSSAGDSSSEITLMEENISAYCEPFGTAVLPQVKPSNKYQLTEVLIE